MDEKSTVKPFRITYSTVTFDDLQKMDEKTDIYPMLSEEMKKTWNKLIDDLFVSKMMKVKSIIMNLAPIFQILLRQRNFKITEVECSVCKMNKIDSKSKTFSLFGRDDTESEDTGDYEDGKCKCHLSVKIFLE
jgi:hypothetical protein